MMEGDGRPGPESNGREELDLLAEELLLRLRRGERPTIEEYVDRRPDLEGEIRAVFPTLLLVEDLGKEPIGPPAPGPVAGQPGGLVEGAGRDPENPGSGLQRVGEYRILREIGRGGMGIVYEAEQESLGRRVALKVLPFHSLLGAKHQERFRLEARAAARLSHPNIVPVFGIGEHLGLHYFAMQYIPGHGLDAVIEEVRRLRKAGKDPSDSSIASGLGMGGRQRYHQNIARIVRDAALALDHAHREGILHRDVKPSNLLLDSTGHVWLADFGLAKSEGSDDLTCSGDFVGTVRYMAPERFKGWSDPRSDVYALGLTLYELLALRPAFLESDRGRLLRKVAVEEPPALRRLDRTLPRDLETIVLKASAKEPAQRYATAQAMARDLDRYLHGEPVEARRSTAFGRFARWCARNPVLAGLCSAVLALLIAVTVISSQSAVELKRERDLGREKLRGSYFTQARLLRTSRQPGQRFGALEALVEASKIEPGADLCDEAAAALALEDARSVKSTTKQTDGLPGMDADRKRIALSDRSGEVVVRSLTDDRELVRLPGAGYEVPFVHSTFHPDGRHLAVRFHKDGGFDRWTIWDLERREAVASADDGSWTGAIDVDPRDGSVLMAVRGGGVRTTEIPSGRTVIERRFPSDVFRLAIHPGSLLIALTLTGTTDAHVLARGSGRILRTFHHPGRVNHMAWDPRGRFLAAGCHDFRAYLWDAETGALRWSQEGHEAEVYWTAFHPRDGFFLTGGWDNQVHAWDAWTGRELFELPRQFAYFSREGNWLGTWSQTGYDLIEIPPAPTAFTLHGHEQPDDKQPHMVSLAPGGRLAATCGVDGVRVWDLISRSEVAYLAIGLVLSAELEAGGDHLITSGQRGLLRWPMRTRLAGGRRRVVFGPPTAVSPMDELWRHSSGDGGRKVAFIHQRSHGHALPLDEPGVGTKLEDARPLEYIAYSPDGRWIAGTSKPLGKVVVWDAASGKKTKTFERLFGSIAFDPRSRYLVVGAALRYQFLRTSDWQIAREISRSPRLSYRGPIAFDSRGEVMAMAYTDSRIWLVEVESGRRITELEAPDPRTLEGLALDLDAGFLGAASRSQRCHFWDLRKMERQLAAAGLPWELRCRGDGPTREPLQVDAIHDGLVLGLEEDLEDPRSPPLFRKHCQMLLRPSLDSYGDIDRSIAAPELLVAEGAAWKYFRGLLEPSAGLEWTETGFDDSAWPRGDSGFSGWPTSDDEARTALGDQTRSFTTLYLRHAFEVEDMEEVEKLLLALRFEDGFIAYLNGKEIARRNAGEPGERRTHDALASRVFEHSRQELVVAVDPTGLVRGKNVLAIQGLARDRSSHLFLLPVFVAALAPDEKRDQKKSERLAKGPDGAPDLALETYRQGRILQRAGKLEEALTKYELGRSLDPASPEPIVRSIECHRGRGEPEAAAALARESLERGGLLDDGGIWALWSLATFGDLRRPLRETLADWPKAQAATSSQGAELRSTVEDLVERGAVRINCGGPRFVGRDGTVWSSDRFYLGGTSGREVLAAAAAPPVPGTDEALLYRTSRAFPGVRQLRPAYRVPVPAGRYAVSLHFAQTKIKDPGSHVLGALLERKVVLEGHEPLRLGFAAVEVKTFEVEVQDGFVDLDFLAEEGNPTIAAIAIERRS